ncbi:1772_t:CDS:2, partial [Acaulospora colombiana]
LPIQYKKRRKQLTSLNGKVTLSTIEYEWLAKVEIGTPGQTLNLLADSGSPETWITTPSCEKCVSENCFDPVESSTFVYNGSEFSMTYIGGGGPEGYFASDVINLGGIVLVNQSMGFITYSDIMIDADGLLALGLSALIKDLQTDVGGEITFGAIDYSKIDGEITYSFLTEDEHWQITVTNVYFNDLPLNLNKSITFPVAFDTGSQQIMMDGNLAESI